MNDINQPINTDLNEEFYPLTDPKKLRVRGGRDVIYNDERYRISDIDYSNRKYKKYVARVENLDTGDVFNPNFGDKRYQDYYQHRDKVRRDNFLKRASGILKKDGTLASEDPRMPAYHATHTNWVRAYNNISNFSYMI